MQTKQQVELRLTELTFIANERDFERGPKERMLTLDAEVYDKLCAWASTQGWRAPGRSLRCRHMPRTAVKEFLGHLRAAIAAEPSGNRGPRARLDVAGALRDFFAKPGNERQLVKVLKFFEGGGELVVEDE